MDKELEMDFDMLAEKEDEMYEMASPVGRWTDRGLNILVKATNKILPLFGQTPDYPMFAKGSYKTLPADFMRVLSMIGGAINDAVAGEALDPSKTFDLPTMITDEDAMAVAAKLDTVAKDKSFKQFLKEPKMAAPVSVEPAEEPQTEMTEEQIAKLFASRLR